MRLTQVNVVPGPELIVAGRVQIVRPRAETESLGGIRARSLGNQPRPVGDDSLLGRENGAIRLLGQRALSQPRSGPG